MVYVSKYEEGHGDPVGSRAGHGHLCSQGRRGRRGSPGSVTRGPLFSS